MESIVTEFSNVGITILCFVIGIFVVRWLDKNVFNKNRYKKD